MWIDDIVEYSETWHAKGRRALQLQTRSVGTFRKTSYEAMVLALHSSTIIAFLAGGVLGVLFYTSAGGAMLIGAGLLPIVICIPELWRARAGAEQGTRNS